MGTNEVTESLRLNEILVDLPLRKKHRTIPVAITSYEHLSQCTYFLRRNQWTWQRERSSERPELAPAQPLNIGTMNDTLKFEHAKMMLSQQLRGPITNRLVAQSRWPCGLLASTRKATLKPKNYA